MYAIVIAIIALVVSLGSTGVCYKTLKRRQDKMLLGFLDDKAELHLLKKELKDSGYIE